MQDELKKEIAKAAQEHDFQPPKQKEVDLGGGIVFVETDEGKLVCKRDGGQYRKYFYDKAVRCLFAETLAIKQQRDYLLLACKRYLQQFESDCNQKLQEQVSKSTTYNTIKNAVEQAEGK